TRRPDAELPQPLLYFLRDGADLAAVGPARDHEEVRDAHHGPDLQHDGVEALLVVGDRSGGVGPFEHGGPVDAFGDRHRGTNSPYVVVVAAVVVVVVEAAALASSVRTNVAKSCPRTSVASMPSIR